jgi:hypothetical protein
MVYDTLISRDLKISLLLLRDLCPGGAGVCTQERVMYWIE